MMTSKKGIATIVAAALAATAALPATAAPAAKPAPTAQVKAQGDATDFSARRYRRGNNAAAAAMFGAVAGTIATIAIAEQRRKRARNYYRYGYYGPSYGYYAPQPYYAPQRYYAPRAYYGGYGGHRYFGAPGTQFGGAVSTPVQPPSN